MRISVSQNNYDSNKALQQTIIELTANYCIYGSGRVGARDRRDM